MREATNQPKESIRSSPLLLVIADHHRQLVEDRCDLLHRDAELIASGKRFRNATVGARPTAAGNVSLDGLDLASLLTTLRELQADERSALAELAVRRRSQRRHAHSKWRRRGRPVVKAWAAALVPLIGLTSLVAFR